VVEANDRDVPVHPISGASGLMAADFPGRSCLLFVSLLKLGDVEFGHLQHPPHHLAGSLTVGISE
jgi:hypothetical protein